MFVFIRITCCLTEKLISQQMISTERTQISSLFTATWLYHIICIVIKMFYIVNKTVNSGIDNNNSLKFSKIHIDKFTTVYCLGNSQCSKEKVEE